LDTYENNPDGYIHMVHNWFNAEHAEETRAKAKRYWATMFYLKVTFHQKYG
jgi:hypothetical protein